MAKPKPHWAARAHNVGVVHGFRSGLEDRNAKHLKAHGEPVNFETFKLLYVVPQASHHYTVDFLLSNGILVETKGLFDPTDRAKHLFVRVQYPELDLRMVFSNSRHPLYKGSPTTYGDWCEKHGIVFADKLIPLEWIKEQGPLDHPETVIKAGPLGYRELLHMEVRRGAVRR